MSRGAWTSINIGNTRSPARNSALISLLSFSRNYNVFVAYNKSLESLTVQVAMQVLCAVRIDGTATPRRPRE